ncbi:MAG: Tyrosine--tRNA ligase, mitochondrial [Cirrosporium novae-zelandiae]|nr:MAG: Tyrosine--tRNA ligase, mitochondrial [Cirrosporium novae-zelandiae]
MAAVRSSLSRGKGPPFVCGRCLFRGIKPSTINWQQSRSIGLKWLAKQKAADDEWAANAKEVDAGKKQSMLSLFEERGYIHSVVGDRKELDHILTHRRTGAYVGIDPSAPSLHVGHLLPFMTLVWLYVHGYKSFTLLGGATAKVGDPTGRLQSRETVHSSIRKANMAQMHYQLKSLWVKAEQYATKYGYERKVHWRRGLPNNAEWWNSQTMLEVLQILGPGVRVGTMLGKETVRNKMEKGDGMSFAEFCYPILQSWDWWTLYQKLGVQIQIGGKDQYGNIMAGIDALKYLKKAHPDPVVRKDTESGGTPIGFTVPLLTTSSGEKFGKSAGNAIWLDKDMTSSFELYQFFLRSSDADVERYLKLFTLIPTADINTLMEEHNKDPSLRRAQHRLAEDCVELIHGKAEANAAKKQHQSLFGSRESVPEATATSTQNEPLEPGAGSKPRLSQIPRIDPTEVASAALNKYAPQVNAFNPPSPTGTLPKCLVYNQPFSKILYYAGLVSSKSEGHRLTTKHGAYVGSRADGRGNMSDNLTFTPIKTWEKEKTATFIIGEDLLILRVGKWKIRCIKVISDEEFKAQGLSCPGWEEYLQDEADLAKFESLDKSKAPAI